MINWTQPQLADASSLGLSTVVDFEKERRRVSIDAVQAMQAALQKAGIVFVPENGEGAGVRLKKTAI